MYKDQQSYTFWFFVRFGQFSNRQEIKLNRILIGFKGLGEIKELPDQAAFRKGVEWFTEIVFFYGICFGIVFYEIGKNMKAAKVMQNRVSSACEKNKAWEVNDKEVV